MCYVSPFFRHAFNKLVQKYALENSNSKRLTNILHVRYLLFIIYFFERTMIEWYVI